MRGRKTPLLRERALASGLFGGIDIHDTPAVSLSVRHPPRRGKRRSGHQIGEKERAQRLHARLIQGRQKPRKRRTIRQITAAKEGHKGARERQTSLVKGFPAPLTP